MGSYASGSDKTLGSLCNQATSSVSQCAQALNSVIKQRENLRSVVAEQKQQVEAMQQQIDRLVAEIKQLEEKIPQLEKKIDSLDQKIAYLNKRLSELRKKLAETKDEDAKKKIQEEIDRAEAQLQEYIPERDLTERKLTEAHQSLNQKRSQQATIKNDLAELEAKLQENERQLRFLTDKCERLKNAYSIVQDSVEALVSSAKKIRCDQTITNSISCVESCISTIDEYLSVNF